MVASVCSGALLLAEAGLLSGKKATTHSFAIEYMKSNYMDIEVVQMSDFWMKAIF
ncbi:DJ-1/PfpI family protein [Aeribacillus sp. FSL K6-8210]|nr:DJ-1/PfpI family protein [Aeribacillus composti]